MEDGRMNVLTRGTRPFRLLARQDELPYPAGTVEFLADVEETPDEDAANDARALYADLVEQATDRSLGAEELAELDAYAMAGTVEFAVEAKQQLLELRSENGRLTLLAALLRAAIKRLELVERAEERARSNGKVRFG
jgi:Lon protease-like protein